MKMHLNDKRKIMHIMQTSPFNEYPLTPHFGAYRGVHYFLIFALKQRLWVLVRTASVLEPPHCSNVYPQSMF